MVLPEQFSEIIALIQTTQDDGIRSEVRRTPRIPHPCHLEITLGTPVAPGATIVVNMVDISPRGMSFVHAGELAIGTEFVVLLEGSDGKSVSLQCRVVHRRELDASTNQFGAEFTRVLNRQETPLAEPTLEDLMVTRVHSLD